jgi:deoxyribodipyrimidine photolyase-related protein
MKAALILNDHLNRHYGVLKGATPSTHRILVIESQRMLTTRSWHIQRLFFLISARDHFLSELRAEGFEITFIQCVDTRTGITEFREKFRDCIIVSEKDPVKSLLKKRGYLAGDLI